MSMNVMGSRDQVSGKAEEVFLLFDEKLKAEQSITYIMAHRKEASKMRA